MARPVYLHVLGDMVRYIFTSTYVIRLDNDMILAWIGVPCNGPKVLCIMGPLTCPREEGVAMIAHES